MRSDSSKLYTLMFVMQLGQIRYSDLVLYEYSFHSDRSNASKVVRDLVNDGWLEEIKYSITKAGKKDQIDSVLTLTRKAENYVVDTIDDDYYLNNYRNFTKPFNFKPTYNKDGILVETDKINSLLTDNGILAMIAYSGTPIFKNEKPSLMYLYQKIKHCTPTPNSDYTDNLDEKDCLNLLEEGIYYSITEVSEFFGNLSIELNDTFTGTRARGVFLSMNNCYVFYTSSKYNNKILRTNVKGEKGFMNAMNAFNKFTEVFRAVKELDEYRLSTVTSEKVLANKFYNSPYAVLIGDGDLLAYSTATGNPKGKIKNTNLASRVESMERKKSQESFSFLTGASSLYEKIYVVTSTKNGLSSLNTLLTSTVENFKSEGIKLVKKNSSFVMSDTTTEIPYIYSKKKQQKDVYYMPIFEAKKLYQLAKSDSQPVILTYKYLMDSIARSIRKDVLFYDIQEQNFIDKDYTLIYDFKGNIAGKTVIENYLQSKGLAINDVKQLEQLPALNNMSYNEFFNGLARNKIEPSIIDEHIDTKEYVKPPRTYTSSKNISISLNLGLLKEVQAAAKEKGISVSSYITMCIKKANK